MDDMERELIELRAKVGENKRDCEQLWLFLRAYLTEKKALSTSRVHLDKKTLIAIASGLVVGVMNLIIKVLL